MDKNDNPTIIIKSGKTIRRIELADLYYIECDCYVCTLSMSDGSKIHCTYSLTYFEEKLPQQRFYRISRDVIVNLNHVTAIKSKPGNKKTTVMIDGNEFDIAFRRWKLFKMIFFK